MYIVNISETTNYLGIVLALKSDSKDFNNITEYFYFK